MDDRGPTPDPGALPLRQALHDYSAAVVALLRRVPPDMPPSGPLPSWGVDADGLFHRRARWPFLPLGSEVALERLPPYQVALDAARRDERAARRLDAVVGTMFGSGTYQARELLVGFAMRVAQDCRVNGWDDDAFDTAFGALEHDLDAEEREVRVITLLVGLCFEGGQRIDLGTGTSLDRLTDDEVIDCLTMGVLPSHFDVYSNDPPLWGIRVTRRVPLLIGPIDDRGEGASSAFYQDVGFERELVLRALRLTRLGRVRPVGNFIVGHRAGWVLFDSLAPVADTFPTYELVDADVPILLGLADDLRDANVRAQGSLQNALRRFNDAGLREGDEDRIVDLMIVAESLFVDTREGEVTFRMSLNGAWFVGADATERQATHHLLKSAYKVRSDVVHGNEPTAKSRRRPDGAERSMAEFVGDVEDVIRSALRKALPLARGIDPDQRLVDWDRLTLGIPQERA